MSDEKIDELTAFLWTGTIKESQFNLFNNEYKFIIKINYGGEDKGTHELTFIGVSTYYFINGEGEQRKNIYELNTSEGEYIELTTVNYVENINFIVKSDMYPWMDRYSAQANVYLEMWDRVLFLECTGMRIDHQTYMFN